MLLAACQSRQPTHSPSWRPSGRCGYLPLHGRLASNTTQALFTVLAKPVHGIRACVLAGHISHFSAHTECISKCNIDCIIW